MAHAATANDPAKVYRRNLILNASPEKLIVLLYEGALHALERAKIELQTPGRERSSVVGEQLGKAMAIVGELRVSLDMEKGEEIAVRLDQLYEFCLDRIYMANVERTTAAVSAPIGVLRTLKEGWDVIVSA